MTGAGKLVLSLGSAVGGSAADSELLAGFAPGMVSHVNGHPDLVNQFLIPFIARPIGPGYWRP